MSSSVTGDLSVTGNVTLGGVLRPDVPRSNMELETLAQYPIPWADWRVWDAFGTNLPATPLTDDLGLVGGTFGTDGPSIQTEDLKAAGATTSYARAVVTLPPEYQAGRSVRIRLHAGMLTTVADTTATIDVEAYKLDEEAGIGSDLCATAAISINNLVLSDKDFTITASGLEPGDQLDVRIAVAVNDAATGTAVVAIVGAAHVLADIRG